MKSSIASKERKTFLEILRKYSVIATALLLVLVAVISTGGTFLTANNLLNVGERAAAIGIVALGQMVVILTGGIDLSVSGIIAIGFSFTTLLSDNITTIPIPLVILLMISITVICGAINGLLISKTKIPPFMITLGTYLIFQSIALVLSGAANLSFENQVDWMYANLGLTGLAGRIFPTLLWIVVSGIIIFILASTRFGKNVYSIGASELASKMSGIRNDRVKFSVYALSGLMCGLATLTIEFRLRNINPASSASYQIDSIAAVIVGGTSLAGGEGNVYGTFIGAFIMASLVNLMNLVGLDVYSQSVVKGVVLIGFILVTSVLANTRKDK